MTTGPGAESPEVVQAARRVAAGLAERAAANDGPGEFPLADLAALRSSGLLGLLVPARLGGLGAGFAEYVEVAMVLAAGSGATALVFNMHASVTGALARTPDALAHAVGAPESSFAVRDKVLADAAGGAFYAVAMSERGAGARLSQLRTSYVPVDGGYRITGSKAFVSGSAAADAYLVAARSAVAEQTVSYFLVPAGPGTVVERTWDSLGMRATGSHDLHLDTVVDHTALLGGVEGLALLLAEVMPQWLIASYAAVYVGVAQAALDAAVAHLGSRGLQGLPQVRARLGRADAQVCAARQVVRRAAALIDAAPGEPATNRWVWRAKLVAGDTAADVAASMLEAAGTSAARRGHALERLYRDARCGALQPATSDVCADWLGVAALGGDPDAEDGPRRW
ncbi:MAG: acyl-CoA dehydrogenase [Actinomycetota bacterium]|nr:MAG: acyl-CoA dehydrogenase [Actinomycetota bacterium]